jgi:beta-galactosidase
LTGFDYLRTISYNEGTPQSSYFGIVDLAGLPKDRYILFIKPKWSDKPVFHVLPHWTWPERLNQKFLVLYHSKSGIICKR